MAHFTANLGKKKTSQKEAIHNGDKAGLFNLELFSKKIIFSGLL